MKKLLIAMTTVSALSVFADNPFSATAEDFDSQTVGPFVISDVPGADYWAMADYDAAADDVGEVKEEDGNKFLAVETSSKTLYRTLKEVKEQEIVDTADIADGLVFDTLVKFTCRDTLDDPTLDDGAKIAIWAGYDGEVEESPTNLYITAAAVNAGYELPAANFLLDADVDFSAWHRVTIRADKDVSTDDKEKLIGFKVWVDEKQVVADETDYAGKIDPSVLSESAKKDLAARQLFIGLEKAGDLAALGFNGQGSVDNIGAFDNANAPKFTKGTEGFEMRWDSDVIASLSIGDEAIDVSSGSFNVTSNQVTVTVGFKTGYCGKQKQTLTAEYPVVVADVAKFMIGDKGYATLADALVDADGKTVKVVADCTIEDEVGGGEDEEGIVITVTLDLAGKTLTSSFKESDMFWVGETGSLTIIDSVGGGKIVSAGTVTIFYSDGGAIVLGSESGFAPTFEGKALYDTTGTAPSIIIGRFKTGDDQVAIAALTDPKKSTTTTDGDYVVVKLIGGDEPTPVEPGKPTQVTAKDADEAISKVKFKAPDAVTEALGDTTDYAKLFKAKATEVEVGSGTWEVTFVLTEAATQALQEEVDDAETILGAVVDGEGEATIKATPGIYYSVMESGDVTAIKATGYKMATGAELTLPLEQFVGSGFYQIRATVTKPDDCGPIVAAE